MPADVLINSKSVLNPRDDACKKRIHEWGSPFGFSHSFSFPQMNSLPFIKMNCLAHIEREIHKIDNGKVDVLLSKEVCNFYDTLIDFCKQNNIYMEVNESSLVLPEGGSIERMLYWVRKARDNGNMISLGTDAHSCYEVGKFDNVAILLNELNYPKDLILNCDDGKLQDLFKTE